MSTVTLESKEKPGAYDDLTGLPNRALFSEKFRQMIDDAPRHGQKLAVFFIDLDKFKGVNDTYGHERGDWLLRSAAQRLSHGISEDDILARLGGDEFLLVARIASLEDSAVIAHRLVKALETPFSFDDTHVKVSVSVGISVFPDHGHEVAVLMHRADLALYRAKHMGRNNYQFFSTSIDTQAQKIEVLESSLMRALANHEFTVLYQPQQNLHTGEVSGVEVLVRWEIPGYGLLAPEKFIAAADETGLIVEIEKTVWKLAAGHIQSWRRKGLRVVPVTLRVSRQHFAKQDLVDTITTLLKDAAIEPRFLTLQIGLSTIVESEAPVLLTLRQLKDLGVRLVLTEIGQPYLDLFRLKTLPVHSLAIDRTLLWESSRDAAARETVQWLVRLAHHLRLQSVAQGVETPEQLAFLKECGCDRIQGFVYSPPISQDEWVKQWLITQ